MWRRCKTLPCSVPPGCMRTSTCWQTLAVRFWRGGNGKMARGTSSSPGFGTMTGRASSRPLLRRRFSGRQAGLRCPRRPHLQGPALHPGGAHRAVPGHGLSVGGGPGAGGHAAESDPNRQNQDRVHCPGSAVQTGADTESGATNEFVDPMLNQMGAVFCQVQNTAHFLRFERRNLS